MPTAKFKKTSHGAWAVWHIAETENELACLALESCPDNLLSPTKRLEFLAVRALLRLTCERLGIEYQGLEKNEFGKPQLKGASQHVSLTHSFPYVAVQIDACQPVGIDLEQPRENLSRVASRVFTGQEQLHAANQLITLCIYWCAKEALYKLYGKRGLSFQRQLAVEEFHVQANGYIAGQILVNPVIRATLHYQTEADYVLVTTEKVVSF